jgi:hypothetical protein
MDHSHIIDLLDKNKSTFAGLLLSLPEGETNWKPAPDKWSLLEVVCHLRDEEVEDFRTRTQFCLELPKKLVEDLFPPSIEPQKWVTERNYAEDNFVLAMAKFLNERSASIDWLRSLDEPDWERGFVHKSLGLLTAEAFLANWLAHDYLHIQQILRLKLAMLKMQVGSDLGYAGG